MLPKGTEKGPVSIAHPELFRLCYILMVRCIAATMTQKVTNKLQIIQNKIIRFILDLGPRTHITTEHMADLNTLKLLPERAKQLRLNTTHKIYYNQAPTYLQTNYNKARDRTQQTRGSHLNFVVVPNVKGAESNTLYCNAIKDWKK